MELVEQVPKLLAGVRTGCDQAFVSGEPDLSNGIARGEVVIPWAQIPVSPHPGIVPGSDAKWGQLQVGGLFSFSHSVCSFLYDNVRLRCAMDPSLASNH